MGCNIGSAHVPAPHDPVPHGRARMTRHLVLSRWGCTGAGAVVVAGTFLPWMGTGDSARSSYDLFGLLDRIGVAEDGVVGHAVRWWPVVPLLVVVSVLCVWAHRHHLAVASTVVAAAYAGGVATALVLASRTAPVRVGPGPWVTSIGAVLLLVAVLVASPALRRHVR